METGDSLSCSSANDCAVVYHWNYTPRLQAIMPPIVYKGLTMIARIDHKKAPDYYKGSDEILDLRLDGTRLEYGDYVVGNTEASGVQDVWGTIHTETRNMTAQLQAKYRGAGYAHNETETLAIYSLDGISNYTLKMYPSIESISHTTGYANGGQLLTIDGVSLDGDEVTILVDGVACVPQTIEKEQLTCLTGKKDILESDTEATTDADADADVDADADADADAESTTPEPSYYIGQQGLKRYTFDNSAGLGNWMDSIGSESETARMLWTAPEISGWYLFENQVTGFTSYFRAPANGEYRFYMACDDSCYMKLSVEDGMNPDAKEELLYRG